MPSGSSERIVRDLFVGKRGADRFTFACLDGGGYVILCNGRAAGTWDADYVGEAVKYYLTLIDRPITGVLHPDGPGHWPWSLAAGTAADSQ